MPSTKKSQGKIKLDSERLFSRYPLIRLSDVSSNWSPIRSTRGVSQLLRFDQSTEPVVIPDPIVQCLKQFCTQEDPLHQLFQGCELLEVTKGPFKGLLGFFQKFQTLPDVMTRALLLVEILGSVQKISLNLPHFKKSAL